MAGSEELDYEALPTTSLRIQLLAGAIAGIAEHTIVYPIDAIKVCLPVTHTHAHSRQTRALADGRLVCRWLDRRLRRCIRG
jgi:hypothetical protein